MIAIVVSLAAIAWLRVSTRDPGGMTETPQAATPSGASQPPAGTTRPGMTITERLPRPRSLRGTRTDGGLVVDADGRFVPTIDARRLFDDFLSASGELAPEALRARIVSEIERRLSGDAARDATRLLDRYLAYRERVRLLATDPPTDPGALEDRMATLASLRREVLGPAATEAFFADEEAQTRHVLEIRRIAADPTLSVEERAARVEALYAALEADLPAEVRESRATTRLVETLRRAEEELRASGASPDDVRALRERLAGPEVAARLADLDVKRAQWQSRVNVFRSRRERLLNDPTLAPSERTAAVEKLLEESFTPVERQRVQ